MERGASIGHMHGDYKCRIHVEWQSPPNIPAFDADSAEKKVHAFLAVAHPVAEDIVRAMRSKLRCDERMEEYHRHKDALRDAIAFIDEKGGEGNDLSERLKQMLTDVGNRTN